MIDYSDLAKGYDENYKSDWCKRENFEIQLLLAKHLPKTGKVVDIGCGTGLTLDLSDRYWYYINPDDYTGIDTSLEMLRIAIEKHPEYKFERKPAKSVKKNRYKAALCLFSIPYITEEAVEPIVEALKKNGVLICVYYDKPYRNDCSVYYGRKWYYRFFVHPKVKRIMKQFGKKLTLVESGLLTQQGAYRYAIFKK